jgi:hypothetical protein
MPEGFDKPQPKTQVSPNLLPKLQPPRVSENLVAQFKDVLRSPQLGKLEHTSC